MKQAWLSVAFFELHGFNEPHVGDPGLLMSRQLWIFLSTYLQGK